MSQALTSRETDPLESTVISVTRFHGGEAFNVMPGTSSAMGSIACRMH